MRQYWIIKEKGYSTWVNNKALNSGDTEEEIHVIEYAAYQSLKDKYDELVSNIPKVPTHPYEKELLERIQKLEEENKKFQNFADFLNEGDHVEKLEQANKVMRDGLKYIAGDHGIKTPELVEFSHIKARLIINQADEILKGK